MSLANKIRFQYDMRVRPLMDPDLRRLRILAQQPYLFPEEDALTHLRLALEWMWQAHLAVDREGLPNKFSLGPAFGIGVPYPETTGYTLNTFLATLGTADAIGPSAHRLRELIENCCTKRLPGILPPLSLYEALETTKIHSVAGKLPVGSALMYEHGHLEILITQ